MITNPSDLYAKLLSDFNLPELTICDLHKPCNKAGGHRCTTVLTHKVIDFDKVKIEYQRGKAEPQKASTDGFTYKDNLFCFVELKGWADFLVFHTNLATLQSEIKEQADKYDLNKKLTDSMLICKSIAQNESIFKNAQIAFVLVTDIDIDDDGAMELYSDLVSLAETSTSWELVCNRELKGKLSVLPSSVSTYYVKCQKFDEILTKIY